MRDGTGGREVYNGIMKARNKGLDLIKIIGRYRAICRDKDGKEIWREEFDNLLTQTGKGFLLDEALSGSSYTAACYMGLISATSFTGISGGDTPASHSGWLEAGSANTPTYSGTRQTCAWAASTVSGATVYSATKSLSTGLVFTFTGSGTVEGAFIVVGSGASATIGNTGGILYSAGTLGTAQPVVSSNTLTISYSTTLT